MAIQIPDFRRIDEVKESINKETKQNKKRTTERKNTVTEMKNTLESTAVKGWTDLL